MTTRGEERRKRRAEARKNEILNSAATVFREKGYNNATIIEIADAADVAEGTIYQYFSNKRELFIQLLKRNIYHSKAALENKPPDDPKKPGQDLKLAFMFQFQIMKSHPFYAVFVQEALRDPEIHDLFYTQLMGPAVDEAQIRISGWIEAGIGRPIDERIAAQAVTAMLIGFDVILNSKSDPYLDALPPEAIGEKVADILLYGLTDIESIGPEEHQVK